MAAPIALIAADILNRLPPTTPLSLTSLIDDVKKEVCHLLDNAASRLVNKLHSAYPTASPLLALALSPKASIMDSVADATRHLPDNLSVALARILHQALHRARPATAVMNLGKLFTVDRVTFLLAWILHATSLPVNPLLPHLHPGTGMLSFRTRIIPLTQLRPALLSRHTPASILPSAFNLRPPPQPLLPLPRRTSPLLRFLILHLTPPHRTPLPPPIDRRSPLR